MKLQKILKHPLLPLVISLCLTVPLKRLLPSKSHMQSEQAPLILGIVD